MKRDDEPSIADEIPHNPTRLRCHAQNCRLAGALADSSRSTSWWCAYHFGVHPNDLPRVTSVLHEHSELLLPCCRQKSKSNRCARSPYLPFGHPLHVTGRGDLRSS